MQIGLQPLVIAVLMGDIDIVHILLQAGAPVNGAQAFVSFKHSNLSPLSYAAAQSATGIMQALIKAGADVNHCHHVGGLTPLQAAILYQASAETLEMLLTCPGIDIWHPGATHHGTQAFAAAVCSERSVYRKMLIEYVRKRSAFDNIVLDASQDAEWQSSLHKNITALGPVPSDLSMVVNQILRIANSSHGIAAAQELAKSMAAFFTIETSYCFDTDYPLGSRFRSLFRDTLSSAIPS